MKFKLWGTLVAVIAIAVLSGVIVWPKGPDLKLGSLDQELKIHQGLDLLGGTHLVYEADMSKVPDSERGDALEGVKAVLDRRINALGVSEPVIQTTASFNSHRVIVELPGITDSDQAIALIGQTAQLEFREGITGKSLDESGQISLGGFDMANWSDIGLNGSKFKKAQVQIDQNTLKPVIAITFNDEGSKLFEEATTRNVGRPIAIFLDNELLSFPRVDSAITGGSAVISGSFTLEQAKQLAIQLNAGALPVPIELAQQRNIGATLGQDSVHQSFIAGLIGLLAIAIFMIVVYRLPGLLSVIALGIYSLIVLALFKLIPVTLTLAGIAGFILSIGMAVDANVLIFERLREELRSGKAYSAALRAGFDRAWTSIRDSNASSLITCAILFYFGTGLIKGFALTLALGILVSMFTAITVTRTLLSLFIGRRLSGKSWLIGN